MEAKNLKLNLPGLPRAFSLVEFIPNEAADEQWDAYFTLSETIFREFKPEGRLPDRDAARRLLEAPNPLYAVERWMVFDKAKKAAAYAYISYDTQISPDYRSNRHLCQIHISVIPRYRRKKIATILLKHLLDKVRLLEKTIIMTEVDNPLGLEFRKQLRGKLVHEETQYRLDMEDVDWQVVDQWLQRGRTKHWDTKMEFFKECPEKDLEEFTRVYTEIINQRPIGNMGEQLITTPASRRIEERNLNRRGIEWYTMVSREHDGQISGLTDIMYNPEEPHRLNQYFTGILAKYRRRGLAKRLKAEMLRIIRNKFPEVECITTTTARTNRPMRAINKDLGFQPVNTCFMFQWPLRELKKQANGILAGEAFSDQRWKTGYRKGCLG